MRPIIRLSIIITLLSGSSANAQQPMKTYDYETAWKMVEESTNKGLPESALKQVNEIYTRAKQEKNSNQLIKSIIHAIKFSEYKDENAFVKNVSRLEKEVKEAVFPAKQLLHSMIAEVYWRYYEVNRSIFSQRSKTENFKNDDISTWSLEKIVETVIANYQLSLENADGLKQIKTDTFNTVIKKGDDKGKRIRPTLFDFLAHRAIDFYKNDEPAITKPAYSFVINTADYLDNAEDFCKLNIITRDSLAFKYYALNIFQDLTCFHLKDGNTEALVDIDLKRMKFVYKYLTLSNKEELYLTALQHLEHKYNKLPVSTLVTFAVANVWGTRGEAYNAQKSEEHKWDKKKAYDICQSAIDHFPDSDGAILAYNYQQNLLAKSIGAQLEKINVPNLPFRALVSYKNFNTVSWRIIKINRDEVRSERKKYQQNYQVDSEGKFISHFLAKPSAKTGLVTLPGDTDLQLHSAEIKLDGVPEGDYMVLFSPNPNFTVSENQIAYAFTTVSNISYVSRNLENGSTQFCILNRSTGEPIAGASAQLFFNSYSNKLNRYVLSKGNVYTSNPEGILIVPFQNFERDGTNYHPFLLDLSWQNDFISTREIDGNDYENQGQFWQSARPKQELITQTLFFLDRAIYRPGQTLYFKGLVYSSDGQYPKIVPNKTYSVTFFDVNNQVVSQKEVTTNEYGTFNGTFTTPSSGLTGQMHLAISDTNGSYIYFSVEEYKRPKFEVNFDPIKGSFRLGETIKTTGKAKAYSGATIDGASVKYRVVREARFPYWWWCWRGYYPSSPEVEIINGTTTTDATGNYAIDFTALSDESIDKKTDPTFYYTIYADITDMNGETHSAQSTVGVGYKLLLVGVKIDNIDQCNENTLKKKYNISTTNLSGTFEAAQVTIKINRLKNPERAFRERLWLRPDRQVLSLEEYYKNFPNDLYDDENNFFKWETDKEVFNKAFHTATEKDFVLSNIAHWKPGKYKLEITGTDKFGQDVKEIAFFDVTNSQSKDLSIPEINLFSSLTENCEPGEKATLLVGSSEKINGLYEIERDGKIIESRRIAIHNAKQIIEIPIKEEYRGNITVHYTFVKNSRPYTSSVTINVPYTNKQLDIRFETFRNKLQPGEQEQWKLIIKGKTADKAMAEMAATLYDASLDIFRANNWNASFYNPLYAKLNWNKQYGFDALHFKSHEENWYNHATKTYNSPDYDYLEWFGVSFYNYARSFYKNERVTMDGPSKGFLMQSVRAKKIDSKEIAEEFATMAPLAESAVTGNVSFNNQKPDAKGSSAEKKQDFTDVKIRKNFNETAFFYPNLLTNENGEVILNFTIPEALTRWKMLGFAHTKELASGIVTNELVTQKDLMVVPNQPRFFRENDKMAFAVKITSLVDSALAGQAQLDFFDALTMQPVNAHLKNQDFIKPFTLKAKQSANLEWNIEIPEGLQAITYRVVAKAGNFSDGEEMTLPVVTNRMLVTETLPLPIRGKQTKTFTLEKLANNTSTTLRNHRYTLEFTSNPAWYAVQALPYLMEYPYECTEQTFSRFYANTLASHIANSNQKIKRVFDLWANLQPDALLSNLEKNQELKSALLEETPWVLNAKNENQRKRDVALLFDLNKMGTEQVRTLKKMMDSQTGNGGFSWFPGFPEDRYITQYIVAGFGHLDVMGIKSIRLDEHTWGMVNNALTYIDGQMNKTYQHLKDEAKKGLLKLDDNHLGCNEIQYLYARSFFKDVAVQNEHKEALNYFLGQAKKYWLQNSIYMEGMMALSLQRYGDKLVPAAIIKSLRERALHSEEMGMYWKTNNGYFWYQAPIETQALMIEVFDEVAADKQAVEDLKTWLLKQKQTQDWRTTKATSEACYALLRRGTDALANDSLVEIKVGNEIINPTTRPDIKAEAGTGYFKTAWTANEITPEMGNIQVTKKTDGVAWGAVYWQYFEQLDKITAAETPLKLKKQLFLQQNTDQGPIITPITETTKLKLGDLVKVRIELRVDRDMEYIHLKDMRAAGLEPTETISTFKYQDGLYYYQSTRDLATNFFIGWLSKGTYVFEYPLRVSQKGDFSNGVTTIQCMYAPEFSSHSEGVRVTIN